MARFKYGYPLLLYLGCLLVSSYSFAESITLWPDEMPVSPQQPGEEVFEDERIYNVRVPELIAYPAPEDKANGTAVLIFPGGAYEKLSIIKEGTEVAEWLNTLGVSAFVVKYRLREYGHPAPLMDGLRAMQIVRGGAKRWHVDSQKIGILGFSAGGHLASSIGVHFKNNHYLSGDLFSVSARPDFMILIYPVISFSGPYAHRGSREALLGSNPSKELIKFYSTELHADVATPPAFLIHSSTDDSVPMENSLVFYMALRKAGIPAEIHIYQRAQHGFGLRKGQGPASEWPRLCESWLRLNGWIE